MYVTLKCTSSIKTSFIIVIIIIITDYIAVLT